MNSNRRSDIRFAVSVLVFLMCLSVMYPIAFQRGETSGIKKAQVCAANDSAFYCYSGLRGLDDPQKWKPLLQICLDGEAIRLSEICLTNPRWIGRSNYNLLVTINKYLVEHKDERSSDTVLRPVDQVIAKITEATARLESIHTNMREWKDVEPPQTNFFWKSR